MKLLELAYTILIVRLDPVEITVSADGKRIEVHPISDEYLQLSRHPAYQSSSIVQNSAAASRLLVTGAGYISNLMTTGAEQFTQKTKPSPKPMVFAPTTHERVRKINTMTQSAASLSSKTVGQAAKVAQNIGATLARRSDKPDKKGAPPADYKPGLLNKSMIAFSTIADGIATSGKHLLTTSGAAATTVVGHRFGPDAEKVAAELAGGVKNVGLVYIDVTGVSRRALIKSTVSSFQRACSIAILIKLQAKGMVVGRVKVKNGEDADIVVGGQDNTLLVPHDQKTSAGPSGSNQSYNPGQPSGTSGPGLLSYENSAQPPAYASGAQQTNNPFAAATPSRDQNLPDGQYPSEKGQYR